MAFTYRVHPMVTHMQAMAANLEKRTGRNLDAWADLLKAEAPDDDKGRQAFLKSAHGLGGPTAFMIVEWSAGRAADFDSEAYLAGAEQIALAQYEGRKAALRPLYEELMKLAYALGPDVAASPCKTMVPVYRKHVVAEIKAATRDRIDLGLALKAFKGKTPSRLISTGGAERGDRITHRIPVSTLADIDADLKLWLETAYKLDA